MTQKCFIKMQDILHDSIIMNIVLTHKTRSKSLLSRTFSESNVTHKGSEADFAYLSIPKSNIAPCSKVVLKCQTLGTRVSKVEKC